MYSTKRFLAVNGIDLLNFWDSFFREASKLMRFISNWSIFRLVLVCQQTSLLIDYALADSIISLCGWGVSIAPHCLCNSSLAVPIFSNICRWIAWLLYQMSNISWIYIESIGDGHNISWSMLIFSRLENDWLFLVDNWMIIRINYVISEGLWGLRNFKLRNIVFVRFLMPGEEGIRLRIKGRRSNRIIVMRDADVIIEDAEAIISVLPNSCFLLAENRFVLVNDLLNDLIDVRIELHVNFFWLDDRLHQIALFCFFFVVFFQFVEGFLVKAPFLTFSDVFLNVLFFLACLILRSADNTKHSAFDDFGLA